MFALHWWTRDFAHVDDRGVHADGGGIAVQDQVGPLVEYSDPPVAARHVVEVEVPSSASSAVKAKSAPSGLPRLT